ncbi:MAG: hypothetical protein MN733_28690, partial [Nitrososphaera sp.]|nr:hypothetical protein [Nitrososphaera sp.]
IIKTALLTGIDSREYKVSVTDLARLQGRNPKAVYDECLELLARGSVSAVRKPITPARKIPQRTAYRTAVPITVS